MNTAQKPGHLWQLIQAWMDSIPYGASQRQLASRVGVSSSALTDWKYGKGFPSPATLMNLANEIQVPYEVVLDAVLRDRGYRLPSNSEGQVKGS